MVKVELQVGSRYMYAGHIYHKGKVYAVSEKLAEKLLACKTGRDMPHFAITLGLKKEPEPPPPPPPEEVVPEVVHVDDPDEPKSDAAAAATLKASMEAGGDPKEVLPEGVSVAEATDGVLADEPKELGSEEEGEGKVEV